MRQFDLHKINELSNELNESKIICHVHDGRLFITQGLMPNDLESIIDKYKLVQKRHKIRKCN